MNKRTAPPTNHWASQPLAGRLLPTFWQRPAGRGRWEPYLIDERKLSAILTWIVEKVDQPLSGIDPEAEIDAALGAGESLDSVLSDISAAATRHLHALDDRDREQAQASLVAALPPAVQRALEEQQALADSLLPRTLDDDRTADRAAALDSAIRSGAGAFQDVARHVWAVERAEARRNGTLVADFIREFGPLLAAPYAEQRFETRNVPSPTPVPLPPDSPDLIETLDELRQIRHGVVLLHAIQSGNTSRVSELVSQLRQAKARGVPPITLRRIAKDEAERARSDSEGTPSPGGDLGVALQWFVHMASRWPFQVWPDQPSGRLLLPVPVGIAQLTWLVLGHNAGAFRLPFERANNLSVRFCAECGRPISSSKPRHRGTRWFCDPPRGKERSVCANRYFSREAKRRARNASAQTETRGKGGTAVGRRGSQNRKEKGLDG